jgi:hypothetical protein
MVRAEVSDCRKAPRRRIVGRFAQKIGQVSVAIEHRRHLHQFVIPAHQIRTGARPRPVAGRARTGLSDT